jgi:ligand-binding sensor domain-containing protein
LNKHFLNINHLFISLFFVVTSCNSQVKTDPHQNIINQQKPIEGDHPKIIRTQGATSGNLTCELQDRVGNLWFSTGGEGVYRFDGKSFTNFTSKDGLNDNTTSTIIQDKSGNILIGTKAGICKYDGKIFKNYFETDSLNNLRITTLMEDRDGNIWFGTINSGVYRYDGKNVINFLNNDDHPFNLDIHYQLVMDILQDRNGNIWFSSWNGGGVWRYDGKTFTNFLPSTNYYLTNEDGRTITNPKHGTIHNFSIQENAYSLSQNSITDDMIFSISEDKEGNLWFATRRHGVCRYDGKIFTSFKENDDFVSYGIYSIHEDKKGNMWFSTDKNGVFCYDGKTFKNYTTADGLVNNSVFSILEDKDENLWFGTRWFGLSRFDGKTFTTFSAYNEE